MSTTVDTSAPLVVPQQRSAFDALRTAVDGEVHEPHEEAFAGLVTPWNVAVQLAPVAAVAARSAQDVVKTVRFAAAHGLTVGVQATGHGPVAALAGSILISTRGLDELTVHPEGWARVGAGVKWGRLTQAAAQHGLAGLSGSTGDVGVVGYTTGGGVGPMARTFGLASDRVRAFEVVTGDGELRRVTATEHPDLFFALRGGKGAAGIVTAIELDLVPLARFYGGGLYFDAADAPVVVDRWRAWSAELPTEGTTSFIVLQLPEGPMAPPPLAGRRVLGVRFLWTGDTAEGERLIAPMRAAAPMLLDDVSERPFAAVDSVHVDPVEPMPVVERSALLSDFPAEAAAALLDVAGPGTASIGVEVRQLGGALHRPAEHPDAFDHRCAKFSLLAIGIAFDPAAAPHGDAVIAALSEWDTGRVWPNFAAAYDADSARRAYDPATLTRLAQVARRYDPSGVIAGGAFTREV